MNLSEIANEITAAKKWLKTMAAAYGVAGVLHSGLIRLESAEIALIEHAVKAEKNETNETYGTNETPSGESEASPIGPISPISPIQESPRS